MRASFWFSLSCAALLERVLAEVDAHEGVARGLAEVAEERGVGVEVEDEGHEAAVVDRAVVEQAEELGVQLLLLARVQLQEHQLLERLVVLQPLHLSQQHGLLKQLHARVHRVLLQHQQHLPVQLVPRHHLRHLERVQALEAERQRLRQETRVEPVFHLISPSPFSPLSTLATTILISHGVLGFWGAIRN